MFIFLSCVFFLMWTIKNVFIEFVKILLLFHVFWFFGHEAWGILLGFPSRNQEYTPCTRRWNPNHWTVREVASSYTLIHHAVITKLRFWGYNKEYTRLNLCPQGACSCMKAILAERHSTLLQKHKEADSSGRLRPGGRALPSSLQGNLSHLCHFAQIPSPPPFIFTKSEKKKV